MTRSFTHQNPGKTHGSAPNTCLSSSSSISLSAGGTRRVRRVALSHAGRSATRPAHAAAEQIETGHRAASLASAAAARPPRSGDGDRARLDARPRGSRSSEARSSSAARVPRALERRARRARLARRPVGRRQRDGWSTQMLQLVTDLASTPCRRRRRSSWSRSSRCPGPEPVGRPLPRSRSWSARSCSSTRSRSSSTACGRPSTRSPRRSARRSRAAIPRRPRRSTPRSRSCSRAGARRGRGRCSPAVPPRSRSAVACSRVMLGVHWLSDVVAGLAFGWAWFSHLRDRLRRPVPPFGAPVEQADARSPRSAASNRPGARRRDSDVVEVALERRRAGGGAGARLPVAARAGA